MDVAESLASPYHPKDLYAIESYKIDRPPMNGLPWMFWVAFLPELVMLVITFIIGLWLWRD